MELIKRRFEVEYYLDWQWGVSINKLREDIDAIEKLGATVVDIEADVYYDSAELTIKAISERVETEKEYKERIELNKKREDMLKNRELEQLERLKLKYGK